MRIDKYAFVIVAFFLVSTSVEAQPKKTGAMFHSIEQVGIISGEGAVAGLVQSVNGFSYKSWFGGIGIGIDCYKYRSIPVFADFRKEFGAGKNKWFAFADFGYQFPWVNDSDKQTWIWEGTSTNEFKGGTYFDGGFGYSIHIKRTHAILLSTGYSFKHIEKTNTTNYYPGSDPFVQKYDYKFNRILFKVGWKF